MTIRVFALSGIERHKVVRLDIAECMHGHADGLRTEGRRQRSILVNKRDSGRVADSRCSKALGRDIDSLRKRALPVLVLVPPHEISLVGAHNYVQVPVTILVRRRHRVTKLASSSIPLQTPNWTVPSPLTGTCDPKRRRSMNNAENRQLSPTCGARCTIPRYSR